MKKIYQSYAVVDVGFVFGVESGANVRIRLAAVSKNSITSDTGSSVEVVELLSLSPNSQLDERVGSRFSNSLSLPISPKKK
jgi:hypothetical protein